MTLADHPPTLELQSLIAAGATELLARLRAAGTEPDAAADQATLVVAAVAQHLAQGGVCRTEGLLEVLPDGFGFLRSPRHDVQAKPYDVFVSAAQIRHLRLRTGHRVRGPVRLPRAGERCLGLARVDDANGAGEAELAARAAFGARHAVLPTRPLPLAAGDDRDLAAIGLLAPWACGQRVLLVLPPDVGGGALLRRLARALAERTPALRRVLLLLDQRPEVHAAAHREFDDAPATTVLATTFDEPPARHGAVAEFALALAQREAEAGHDVVLLCDSLTALARADNLALAPTGRLLCAGCDAAAVQRGKRLFAAARALEGGGTLTVLATAVAGPTATDAAILEPFRHRGNAEAAFVAAATPGDAELDPLATFTRSEDLVLPPAALAVYRQQRAELAALPATARAAAVARWLAQPGR
ncbi:MAG: hypothetical protein JNL08_12685 [Planctomycetes bacterium]|nr:hypothetical protein [Planctomycetota bacterium]